MKVFRGLFIGLLLLVAGSARLCAQSIVEQIQAAERSANLNTCLSGQYPALCKHGLLSAAEKTQVDAAELSANLNTCVSGQYPALCKHELLSAAQKTQVDAAERSGNLNTCLSGQYPALCKHEILSSTTEESTVAQTERRDSSVPVAAKSAVPSGTGIAVRCAGNGSCYGDISPVTGKPKTVYVNGYYRKDGTYVRGYYRSAPRK